jgi:hypothetical protein
MMKKILFLISLLFSIQFLKAQTNFVKHYGTHYREYATRILEKNNQYYITGVTWAYTSAGDIFLMNVDSLGITNWTKSYFGVNRDYPEDMFYEGNGFSIIGYTYSYGTGHDDALILTVDSVGNVVRTSTYGTAVQYDRAYYLLKTDGETGYFVGSGMFPNLEGSVLYKTDAIGNIIWSYKFISTENTVIRCIHQYANGNLLVLLTGQYYYTKNLFILAQLDANGNFISATQYSTNSGNPMVITRMLHTSDNGFILAGSSYLNAIGADCDIFLMKTDSVGNAMWCKMYGDIFVETAYDVIQTTDEGYILTGYTNSYGFGTDDAILLKTDSIGTLQWAKTYGTGAGEYGNSVIQTEDGGYAIVGSTFLNNTTLLDSQDVMVIKTDSFGVTDCRYTEWSPIVQNGQYFLSNPVLTQAAYGSATFPNPPASAVYYYEVDYCLTTNLKSVENHIEFNIYPNPAHNTFTISFNSLSSMVNGHLQIFDVTGRVVYEQTLNNQSTIIDKQFSPGIYFIKVRGGEKVFTEKLVVE